MAEFNQVTETFAVSGQLTAGDLKAAAEKGFKTIICNRPDGEERGQPTIDDLKIEAENLGLVFLAVPFSGAPSPEIADQQKILMDSTTGPVLAYCRTGTRSIMAWALAFRGENRRDEILSQAATAGYDLRGLANHL